MTTPQKPRRHAKPQTATVFEWFTPEATAQIGARIAAAGPGARLEIRRGKDQGLLARVVPQKNVVDGNTIDAASAKNGIQAVAAVAEDINDSRRCPPICP